jgi:hypothetical protein
MDIYNADENIKDHWATDDRIIGMYLSQSKMGGPKDPVSKKPMLRRFIHDEKEIRCLEVIGRGEDGVVVLAEIEGNRYALKVVRLAVVSSHSCEFVSQVSSSNHISSSALPLAQKSTGSSKLPWRMKVEPSPA